MSKKFCVFLIVFQIILCWAATLSAQIPKGKAVIKLSNGRLLTVEELREILNKHGAWLRSAGKEGAVANLEGAYIHGVDLDNADFRSANVRNIAFEHTSLDGAYFSAADMANARFYKASLKRAKFRRTLLPDATIIDSNLEAANFYKASLARARIIKCNFAKAWLQNTNFADAFIRESSFHGAKIWACVFENATIVQSKLCRVDCRHVNLNGAEFVDNDFFRASINIKPGKIPPIGMLATGENIYSLTYSLTPFSLIELRGAARKAGLRLKERELTYAVMHNERLRTYHPFWRAITYILFELPSGWGMYPDRPLVIMVILIPFFFLPYLIVLFIKTKNGIWIKWSPNRARKDLGFNEYKLLNFKWADWRAYAYALYFSVLSAFHIGWRDLNVGSWITRMQPCEYTLRATGWVRTVSGIQSLISVYLLALAVLTYFGRPFG